MSFLISSNKFELRSKDMKKMKKKNPLVSVVMPVYNAGGFLVESIESILKQTYKNIELIIVNDASTDDSLKIIKKYVRRYPKKIRLINLDNNLNRGGDSCANLGIKKARGKYIAKMDADDIAYPKRLEKQVEFLEKSKNIFLVGSNAHVINERGKIVGEKNEPLSSYEIFQEYIYFNPIIHPTIMFRNKLKKDENFYKIKYPLGNDYYTFFTLQCKGYNFANLPDKLLKYRIYGKNSSLKNIRSGLINNLKIKILVLSKYHYPLTNRAILSNIAYLLIGVLLPQKISLQLYLMSKNIITMKMVKKALLKKFEKSLLTIRKFMRKLKVIPALH